jgi:hypothetical protein
MLLYYITKNHAIHTMDIGTFQTCVNIPEDLIFIALRDGSKFIKEPALSFEFTDIERFIMSTEFFDFGLIKDEDYRRQNTSFCPVKIDKKIEILSYENPFLNLYSENILDDDIIYIYSCEDGITWSDWTSFTGIHNNRYQIGNGFTAGMQVKLKVGNYFSNVFVFPNA